jgi:4-hydroxy-2-oxoheptanedioate aldolase
VAHPALEQAWSTGRVAFGGWVITSSEASVFAMERAGFDFVGIDCQHGAMSETDAATVLRRMTDARCAVLVRVSENSPAPIGRVLDAGADGIIVPFVNDAEEAERAVAACRYPPRGVRSFGPSRPGLPLSTMELEARVSCFVMVETSDGIANAKDICAVPGVSGVVVGPADLSIALGLEPRKGFTTDQIFGPVKTLRDACDERGIVLGVFSGGSSSKWVEQGCRLIVVGSDLSLLTKTLVSELEQARAGASSRTVEKNPYG